MTSLPRVAWVAWVTLGGSDPVSATRLGRLVVLAVSAVLLWLACSHLVRWLGPRSLLGVAVLSVLFVVIAMILGGM